MDGQKGLTVMHPVARLRQHLDHPTFDRRSDVGGPAFIEGDPPVQRDRSPPLHPSDLSDFDVLEVLFRSRELCGRLLRRLCDLGLMSIAARRERRAGCYQEDSKEQLWGGGKTEE